VNRRLSNLDVAQILEDFIQGTGGGWDWDDFLSIAEVANERLDARTRGTWTIRKEKKSLTVACAIAR